MSAPASPRGAFEREALPHLDAVYRFSRHLTGNEADAEDLAQEAFRQALRKFHQFEIGTNCKAWLFRIARNAHIDRLRQRARQPRSTPLEDGLAGRSDGSYDGWQHLTARDAQQLLECFGDEVKRSLEELPDEFRIPVLLCDVEELSYEEIGQVLACPIGTVRSRISRARTQLRTKLAEYAREHGLATSDGGSATNGGAESTD